MKIKREKRIRRHKKIRAKIKGTNERPRLCVFRSLKHIYAQLINDEEGKTLVVASDQEIKKGPYKESTTAKKTLQGASPATHTNMRYGASSKSKKTEKETARTRKVAIAYEVGKLLAEKALKKKIQKAMFDRGGYKYYGRVKAVAEGAREGGIQF